MVRCGSRLWPSRARTGHRRTPIDPLVSRFARCLEQDVPARLRSASREAIRPRTGPQSHALISTDGQQSSVAPDRRLVINLCRDFTVSKGSVLEGRINLGNVVTWSSPVTMIRPSWLKSEDVGE